MMVMPSWKKRLLLFFLFSLQATAATTFNNNNSTLTNPSNSTRIVLTFENAAQAAQATGLLLGINNVTVPFSPFTTSLQSPSVVVLDLLRPALLPEDMTLFQALFDANNLTLLNCEIDLLVSSVVVEMLPYEAGDGWQYADNEPYSLQMEMVWHN